MGALFFVVLMAILWVLAGIFFLIACILLIISIIKKRKEKKIKRLRILTIVLYCISLIFFAVPAGWIIFLRTVNQTTFDDYVNTGVYVSSTASKIFGGGQFYYDGDLYTKVDNELSGFQIERDQAVANAKGNENALLDKILNYNNEATIYSVKNDSGYTILSCGNTRFYKEDDKDKIISYYHSLAEYEYYYLEFGTDDGIEYIDMDFDKEVFDQLYEKYESGETEVSIMDDYAVEYSIGQTSPDGVYLRDVYVLLTEDSAYVVSTSGGGTHTGYRLDEKTVDLISSTLGFKRD